MTRVAEAYDLNSQRIYLMPQKNELIHSGFSASPLFICGKNIRSSSLRETNIAKSNSTSRIFVMSLMGRVEPHLNGFCLPLSNSPKVGVEFESNCSRIAVNKPKMRPLHTLSTFDIGRYRESYSAPDDIRSSQKSTIFYSKLIMKMVGGNIRIRFVPVVRCRK